MQVAAAAAPEIDRLVLYVNRRVGPEHGARLAEVARGAGLETLDLLPPLGDFMHGGRLTRELAVLRMRYMPPERVVARIDELEESGLLTAGPHGLTAAPPLRTVLEAMFAAQADVASRAWGDHGDDVATASRVAATLGAAATPDHAVAAVHRDLPERPDPHLRLFDRLVTLRYVRQHDHAEAWLGRGLTPPDMVVLTALWHGETAEDPGGVVARLSARGLVDPPELTGEGRRIRDAIEDETNERAGRTFGVLDDEDPAAFLGALRRLPTPEP